MLIDVSSIPVESMQAPLRILVQAGTTSLDALARIEESSGAVGLRNE